MHQSCVSCSGAINRKILIARLIAIKTFNLPAALLCSTKFCLYLFTVGYRVYVGLEYVVDSSLAGRPAGEVPEDSHPVCQAAVRRLRHPVLSFKVCPCHRHPRHIRTTCL